MTVVPSLLRAIIRVDGEALVMHPGDKPYVVSPTGQIELADKGLTLEAVDGIVGQLLSAESRDALDEFGAVQYELPVHDEFPSDRFTIVAARGGDDLWVEIRRRRAVENDVVPDEFFAASSTARAETPSEESAEDDRVPMELVGRGGVADAAYTSPAMGSVRDETLTLPDANQLWPGGPAAVESGAATRFDGPSIDEEAVPAPEPLAASYEATEIIPPPPTRTEIIPPPQTRTEIIPPPPTRTEIIPPPRTRTEVIPPPQTQTEIDPSPQTWTRIVPPRPAAAPPGVPPVAAAAPPRPGADKSAEARSAKAEAPRPEPAVVLPMA